MDQFRSFITLAILFLLILNDAESRDYSKCQLLHATPSTEKEIQFLRDVYIHKNDDGAIWNWPTDNATGVNVLVCPENNNTIIPLIRSQGILYSVTADNVQKSIEVELSTVYRRDMTNASFADFKMDAYYTLEEIYNFLNSAQQFNDEFVSVADVGTTFEGRQVKMIRIGKPKAHLKPAVWLDFGIHAREWISPASAIYIIHKLLTSSDPTVRELVEYYDWYIAPVLNPDGYEYTWKKDRFWRKNRSTYPPGSCFGVDINRNFDANFTGKYSSSNPCAEVYRGPSSFSENESKIVRDQILSLKNRIKFMVTVHSYSQMWLYPYGYKADKPPNQDNLHNISTAAMEALFNVHGTKYKYGNIATVIYPASGSSVDWAYDSANVKYSFAVELRDTGKYGFLLPTSEIIPTADELWAAVSTVADILTAK